MSLVDVLNHLESVDEEMEKEASEMEKIAAEEEAAGRITARGFMDELNKLAAGLGNPKLKPLKREAGLPPPAPLPTQSRTKGYKAPPRDKPYAGSGKAKMGPGAGSGRLAL